MIVPYARFLERRAERYVWSVEMRTLDKLRPIDVEPAAAVEPVVDGAPPLAEVIESLRFGKR